RLLRHAKTRTVIAMAHNVYYKDGKLARPNDERWPIYAVRGANGSWGKVRKLEWDHPEASAIYTSNCSQRVELPGGDVLVPLTHGPKGRADRAVSTVRCSFDGEILRIRQHGAVLRCSVGRGLLEPSLAALDGRIYLTIRAENGQGFISASADGLDWQTMSPWMWDDGEPIEMSTTQQRWLPHSDGLFLVYTRKDATNRNVMRWRAPLWMAEVDRKKLRLIRATERVVIPMNADGVKHPGEVEHQGNFHTTAISASESLVSTGTVVPKTWRGAVRIARNRWNRPNGLVT
ncbi:MAG: exo-alpha-sialidase, partial [Bryobacteraceae bacterium]